MKDYLDPVGRRVGWLLTELERQTADRLSADARQNLLLEVSNHLDSAIQDRLETGMDLQQAEREAVAAFGPPESYLEEILSVHEGRPFAKSRSFLFNGDRRTILSLVLLTIVAGVFVLSGNKREVPVSLLAALAILALLFAYFSFRARRIQAVPIFMVTALAGFVFSIVFALTWDNLYVHGDRGYMSRWQMVERLDDLRVGEKRLDALLGPLENRARLHAKHSDLFGITVDAQGNPSIRSDRLKPDEMGEWGETPIAQGIPSNLSDPSMADWLPGPESSITYEAPAVIISGDNGAWRKIGAPLYEGLKERKASLDRQIAALITAQTASPLSDYFADLGPSLSVVPVWFAICGLINLIFGSLGWFFNLPISVRRRRVA